MIVPTMSKLAICDALFSDLPKLKIKAGTLASNLAKQCKKERKFPVYKWEEYIHQQSRNRYLICLCIPSLNLIDKPEINYVCIVEEDKDLAFLNWGCWAFKKTGSIESIATRYLGIYTVHFFQRYRERYWKEPQMSQSEAICRFFTRNKQIVPLEMNEDIQQNYKDYGEYGGYGIQVHDGTCLIQSWNEGDPESVGKDNCDFISVVIYRTFVNNGMMSDTQNNAIKEEGNRYLSELYKDLYRDALLDKLVNRNNTDK